MAEHGILGPWKTRLNRQFTAHDQQIYAWKLDFARAYFVPGAKVLDVGCGDGRIAKFLQDTHGCHVTGVDTIDYHMTDIPFTCYDGKTLPFADHHFDVVLLVCVIHHADDPAALVREAARVGKCVVLVEDYCATWWGKIGLHVNDYFVNILQNTYKVWTGYRRGSVFDMQWRLKFQTEGELRRMFSANALQLEFFRRTNRSWKGMCHGNYVLAKSE
ncbi:MAG: class I SAM-dependent methyltransferase [Deltaproteobacteria bacterium]|nr:class I SAM-dependent methyltransferase [Deltaproteobacteria bacterium]